MGATNDFVIWVDSQVPFLAPGVSPEFISWTTDGALILDIDESATGLVVTSRRRVAMF